MADDSASAASDDAANDQSSSDGEHGAGSKDALLADLAKERDKRQEHEKARKTAESKLSEMEARLSKIDEANKSDHDKAVERAAKEADAKARAEVMTAANQRLVKAEVRAAAAGKLSDPLDAIRFVDLDEFKVTDDGEVDSKAIDAAITQLLKDKPYLAANSNSKKPTGDADQGARKESKGTEGLVGRARMANAYAQSTK